MPDLKVILDAVDEIRQANVDAHIDIRKAVTDGIHGVHKDITATAWITGRDLKDIKEHLAKLNGTVADLQRESNNRKQAVIDFRNHQKFGKWVHKNWWLVVLMFICSVTLIFVILERFGLIGVLEAVKEVKDVL